MDAVRESLVHAKTKISLRKAVGRTRLFYQSTATPSGRPKRGPAEEGCRAGFSFYLVRESSSKIS